MKIHKYSKYKLFAFLAFLSSACQQETIEGPKATGNEPYKVYFLNADAPNGVINAVDKTAMEIDAEAKTANFPLQIFRGGQAGSEPFTVDVEIDNSTIPALIQSGALPANTIALDASTYTFDTKTALSVTNDMMKGSATPKVNIGKLGPYAGKNVALGFKLKSTSRYTINETKNKVVMYFEVNKIAGPIYFPVSQSSNPGKLDLMTTTYSVNNTANEVTFNIPVQRAGVANLGTFTVDVTVDNSIIAGASLPANTVALDPADYSLENKVNMNLTTGVVQGNIRPKIKISSLDKYSGKIVALGLKLANASQFTIDPSKDKAVVYFNADALLDDVVPPTNQIVNSAWQILKISNNDNVKFTVNGDGSVLATGGNSGHQGIYQAIQVKAGRKYKIDMRVKGSGTTDTWFEVYVGTPAPVQLSDYSSGGNLMGLNTWSGCGKSPFDGQLSAIACSGATPKGVFTASATGTMYVVIRSGGANLGADGITITNIDLRRIP
ncbi:hypothetical protein Pedsa_3328 [Pseudopedobacter saltans DSM 12145]|uniref:BT-3987-like N-terminal domain-containing protein n=1 Tax=Pseudopedobacter saltans (strain ATCC 51119 / DSM 12145 / JCM 21818 / CCUG 39354 / LMG 10337 / NBRC 100064 / NCIMB 13643) TaxID=762903 RepID=F0SCL9_PSESL|nr:DUF1735 domain-containing protein [Pseudopedobacter saltans]ADY53863.1 hypothetical protein Pedsa_3328 [Pseudopedobacter saltans DSM 12145]